MPFFKTLKKVKDLVWTDESHVAFKGVLKTYMTEAHLLENLNSGEVLYFYMTDSDKALSVVLVKKEAMVHKLIYYVSKILHGAELNYSTHEKFVLAMITTSRKLRPYFEAHKIEVLTDQPLRSIVHSPKASARLFDK